MEDMQRCAVCGLFVSYFVTLLGMASSIASGGHQIAPRQIETRAENGCLVKILLELI